MKLKKLKTLNEAIAEISDTDQGVVGIVYADAIRETKQKRKMIDKAFKDRKIEMPNEDRFAHQKVKATKEMKKMQLAESLFTEWVDDKDQLNESFAQPNFALSEDQYILDDKSGNIEVSKDIFSDYIKDGHVNILFVDEEEDGEDKVVEYKMISEDDSTITFEYVGIATPGIDEEIADCQKYPIEKPKAKDSQFVSKEDKQPKDSEKAKDTGFVSAEDKQPEKAAVKEALTERWNHWYRLYVILGEGEDGEPIGADEFENIPEEYYDVKSESTAIKKAKKLHKFIKENNFEELKDFIGVQVVEILNDGDDFETEAIYQTNEDDSFLTESFTNWDSPESRVERYFTDLPGMIITLQDHYDAGRIAADELAKALKVAYDALDSVPQMDEALEASQKYPIEKPKAKNSQFISAGDKQPSTAIDAKDSQFVSAGDKDPNKANKKLVKESVLVEEDEEESEEKGTFVYKNKREPLGDLIQVELTEGEWGYVKYPDGRLSPTRLPSANYLDDRLGADWDKNDRYAITVLGESADDLQKAIDIAVKYGKEYRIEQLARPIRDMKVRIWIYVDEEKDFDEPYFDPNVETVAGKKEDEALEASQKYPVKSPVEKKDSEFISKEDKYPVESPITEDFDDDLGDDLCEIRITTEGLGNFHPYGEEAKATWDIIESNDKIATFEFMLEDMFPNGVGSNQLNDLLKSERDWILSMLNISDKDEVEETETLETSYSEFDDDFDM